MKKVFIIAIALCLLLAGAAGVFLIDRTNRLRETEDALEALKTSQSAVSDQMSADGRATFLNESAMTGFKEAAKAETTDDVAQYISPEGIRFRSQSTAWNSVKLKALYEELLLNKHGEELYTLAEVVVRPDPDDYAAASHGMRGHSYKLNLCFPSLPKNTTFSFFRQSGVITLYDGDENDSVAEMASSLSHEYGHHYTFYYMLKDEDGIEAYEGTEYERLRQIDPTRLRYFYVSSRDYLENHHWYYFEIAAEDYVVLMGSPNARTWNNYCDIYEWAEGKFGGYKAMRNMNVQENLMIPMATQVPGLAEYFYSFIDEPAPTYEPKEITIEMEKKSISYHLTTGYKTFRSYHFTWNKAYGEDAVYTLVCFDPENYRETLYPIRTVTEGEEAKGVIGALPRKSGDQVYTYDDGLAEGTLTFVVTVILPDGTMYCSDPVEFSF